MIFFFFKRGGIIWELLYTRTHTKIPLNSTNTHTSAHSWLALSPHLAAIHIRSAQLGVRLHV